MLLLSAPLAAGSSRSGGALVANRRERGGAAQDEEVAWSCVDFPRNENLTRLDNATAQQRCEAGNLLLDGRTYMYNDGRIRRNNTPGVCGSDRDCWCCARKQRALPPLPEGGPRCNYLQAFNYSGQVSSEIEQSFFTGREQMRTALAIEHGFASCAVVGSSGKLLLAQHGDEIDDHEFVMRVNTAPTLGFVDVAGARTTHRLIATTGLWKLAHDHCGLFGWCLSETQAEEWCPVGTLIVNTARTDEGLDPEAGVFSQINSACSGLLLNHTAMTPEQRDVAHAALTPPGKNFMSGLAGLLVGSMLCPGGLDIYGFDTGSEPNGTAYHYYDDAVVNGGFDDFGVSQQMLLNLSAAQPGCFRLHE